MLNAFTGKEGNASEPTWLSLVEGKKPQKPNKHALNIISLNQNILLYHCEFHHEEQAALARIFCAKVSAASSLAT